MVVESDFVFVEDSDVESVVFELSDVEAEVESADVVSAALVALSEGDGSSVVWAAFVDVSGSPTGSADTRATMRNTRSRRNMREGWARRSRFGKARMVRRM